MPPFLMAKRRAIGKADARPESAGGAERERLSSVATAIRLLKAFSEDEVEIGISELARRLGARQEHRAPARRRRWCRTACWSRTPRAASIASASRCSGSARWCAAAWTCPTRRGRYLYELREKVNESVHLAILDGSEIMYVYNLESTHAIRMRSDIGVRKPVHCTAEGQAILAFQPADVDRARDRARGSRRARRRPSPVADKFIKALGLVRQRGCAIEDEESELGMICVAAPIRDDSGAVVAAMGIAGPTMRLCKKAIAGVIPHVIATAEQVSARLGYRGRATG